VLCIHGFVPLCRYVKEPQPAPITGQSSFHQHEGTSTHALGCCNHLRELVLRTVERISGTGDPRTGHPPG
jgi:hypothetical protein